MDEIVLSASKLSRYLDCPAAYHMKYHQQIPEPKKARARVGQIIHAAIQEYHQYGGFQQEDLDIHHFFTESWSNLMPDSFPIVMDLWKMSARLDEFEQEILQTRPKLKNPRQTKQWFESKLVKEWNDLLQYSAGLEEEGLDDLIFNKTDNLYKLWQFAIDCLSHYIEIYQDQPEPELIEYGFVTEIGDGLKVRGFVDQIRTIINPETGEYQARILSDIKNGTSNLSPQSVFLQSCLYWMIAKELENPPDLLFFHLLSKQTIQPIVITAEQEETFHYIISCALQGIENESFHYRPNFAGCGMCDYKDYCSIGEIFPSDALPAEEFLDSLFQ